MNIPSLTVKCLFRHDGGVFCHKGYLYQHGVIVEPVRVGDELVQCPACEGKGLILTDSGRQLLTFLDAFARPMIRDMVDEAFKERERH